METTMICVDNSEWTRNGDYSPCRFQAQREAVNLIAGAKTETNVENTVGLMYMSESPSMQVTPTSNLGQILRAVQSIQIWGQVCAFSQSLQTAQLALKHRQNKLQRQRIVIFVASPIKEEKEPLVKLAKRLKKNNVAVDIISFAAEEANTEKLEAFQDAVNSADNSHLISIPAGTILTDELYATPIFGLGAGGLGGDQGGGEGMPAGGVDPNLDPELALALRVSLEEEQARQERAQQASGGAEVGAATAATPAPAAASGAEAPGEAGIAATPLAESAEAQGQDLAGLVTPATPAAQGGDAMEIDEDTLLQQALAMSMAEEMHAEEAENEAAGEEAEDQEEPGDVSMFDEYDEELQNAIRMSMVEVQPGEGTSNAPQEDAAKEDKHASEDKQ